MEQSGDYWFCNLFLQTLQRSNNTRTVVIVSSKVTIDEAEYPELSIENIESTFATTKSDEAGYGNKIVKLIYNLYSKTKFLKVMCIEAHVSKGEISGEKANDILKYLIGRIEQNVKNKTRLPVDVIVLPKFNLHTAEDAREIMESLWYLREHTVLISSSSLHATLPSTEVIAVGGDTERDVEQKSVLDFVVTTKNWQGEKLPLLFYDDSDWLDEVLIQSLAPAAVAAVAVNILDCFPKNAHLVSGYILSQYVV